MMVPFRNRTVTIRTAVLPLALTWRDGGVLPALALALALLGLAAPGAQAAATAPASASATQPAGQALTATITAVTGLVQVRLDEDQPWQPAQVGLRLPEGAEFRTGPRSAVQFRIPPDQIITLDRLGTVKVLEAVRTGQSQVRTDLGMKYGRTTYQVESAEVQHDATIRSPAATLAVRGTQSFSLSNHPGQPILASTQLTSMVITSWLYPGGSLAMYDGTTKVGEHPTEHEMDEATHQHQPLAMGSLDWLPQMHMPLQMPGLMQNLWNRNGAEQVRQGIASLNSMLPARTIEQEGLGMMIQVATLASPSGQSVKVLLNGQVIVAQHELLALDQGPPIPLKLEAGENLLTVQRLNTLPDGVSNHAVILLPPHVPNPLIPVGANRAGESTTLPIILRPGESVGRD